MRKTSKGRGYKRKKLNKNNYLYGNYIYVTDHAVTRYQQRIKVSHENAENAIIESVKEVDLLP